MKRKETVAKKQRPNKKKHVQAKADFFTMKIKLTFSLIFLGIAIIVYSLFFKSDEPKFEKEGELSFLKGGVKSEIKKIDIEIANNPTERANGLMNRKSMDEFRGMLFIFEQPDIHRFWMKNTLIPLDIAFIDSTGVIDTIYRKTTPLSETALPSRRRVQFVVETNGGFSDKFGIKEGDLITFTSTSK